MRTDRFDVDRLFEWARQRSIVGRAGRFVFGDRRGLALFLGAICYIAVLTRVGIFITDTYTTANAFVALTEGHLAIDRAVYGGSLETPGMHVVDGDYYGRNYGQLVASLPIYWLLEALSIVADLRIALVGGWSLTLLSFSMVVGRVVDYRRAFTLGGAGFALVLFVANVAVATPIPDAIVPVLAMQLTSVVAGGLVAVVTYRLVRLLTTPRAGVLAGVLVVLATPIAFWAPIPKRHVFTTLLVLVALFAFARSRDPETPRRDLTHSGAYAATGLLAWVHAPEALVLLTALALADVLTSPPARYRSVPTIAGVFVLSLVPFFVTNALISGNPFVPPRLLRVEGVLGLVAIPSVAVVALATRGPTLLATPLALPVVEELQTAVHFFLKLLTDGVETVWYQPDHLYQTFVRSGYVVDHRSASAEAINLSVLESAPLLGALLAVPAAIDSRRPDWRSVPTRLRRPPTATALAIGLFATLFSLLYVGKLPIHAQVTVRYLLPLYAVAVVSVVWFAPLRRACCEHVRTLTWTAAAGVLFGGQLLAVVVVELELAIGEAFQLHALLGLALVGLVAITTLASAFTDRFDRLTAVSVGLTAAATTVFSLLVVTAYAADIGKYPVDGDHVLPIVRLLAELLGAA